MNKTITVKGAGRASAKPDSAVILLSLSARSKEYAEATQKAGTQTELLKNAVNQLGFEQDALKTAEFNVNTEYESVKDEHGNYRNVLKGFVCKQRMRLQFDFDAEKFKQTITALASCSVDPEFSVSFTVKDKNAVNEALLRDAAENAKRKAETLCRAMNVSLGELISIDYGWNEKQFVSPTQYSLGESRLYKAAAMPFGAEITPENIEAKDTATFVWEIK